MKDTILIRELEVFAKHGVLPEENTLGQKFLVSAELYTDFSEAAGKDDLNLSVDYSAVCSLICKFMQENTFRLIETAAQRLAGLLLEEFPLISGLVIEVKKPWAPIGLHVQDVAVKTERSWHRAYIGLGSNIGDVKWYLDTAVRELDKLEGCHVEKVSDFIVTKPYGNVGQDDFLNGVLLLRTYLDPFTLLDRLHDIENMAGRKRLIHWGPRTLDLDILLYDSLIIDSEKLTIPHADMHNRSFVLAPLTKIAPTVRHPVLNKTAAQLLREL